MLIGDEVRDGLSEIPEKAIARSRTFDNTSRQHRQPRFRIVTTQCFELREHVVGPILRTSLPAVVDYILNPSLAHQISADDILIAVEIFLEVVLHKSPIELVHLEARRL